jgi:hypothetical protein
MSQDPITIGLGQPRIAGRNSRIDRGRKGAPVWIFGLVCEPRDLGPSDANGVEYHLFLRFLNRLIVRPYTEYATQPLLGANYS